MIDLAAGGALVAVWLTACVAALVVDVVLVGLSRSGGGRAAPLLERVAPVVLWRRAGRAALLLLLAAGILVAALQTVLRLVS